MGKFIKVIGFIIFAPAALIFGLAIGGAMSGTSTTATATATTTATAPTVVPSPIETALKSLELDYTGYKNGSVLLVDFTIKNTGKVAVKDIRITCSHYAPSGTLIDSNTRTIYEAIKAGQTRKFNKFNMGFIHSQAERSGCAITKIVL